MAKLSLKFRKILLKTIAGALLLSVYSPFLLQPQLANAAIALRGTPTSTQSSTNVTSLSLTKPTGTVAGDVMIAVVGVDAVDTTTTMASTGWTRILHSNNGSSVTVDSFYKVATASEGASYSFSWTGSSRAAGGITTYLGVDNSTPLDVTGTNNTGSGSSVTANAVTTVSANAQVVGVFAIDATATQTYTAPTGMTKRIDVGSATGTPTNVSVSLADVIQTSAGTTGNKSATASGTGTWAAHLFALKAATAPTLNQSAYRFSVNADNDTPANITDNLTTADDTPRGTAIDNFSDVFFTVGDNGANWVIEKRRILDGSLCTSTNCGTTFGTAGRVTEDVAASTLEKAYAIAVDPSAGAIYVAGMDSAVGAGEFRIEKRSESTGALITTFGTGGVVVSDPSNGLDEATTAVIDATNGYLYVGGYDNTGNNQWNLQKYRTDNGNICTAANCGTQFGTNGIYTFNPSNGDDRISALEIDPTNSYLFVAGFAIAPNNRTQWTMQKLRASDAALCTAANCGTQFGSSGTYSSDPTNKDDKILALQVDSAANAIYLGGFEQNATSSNQWRLEKISLDAGALIPSFGGAGCSANEAGALCTSFSSGLDKVYDMQLDGAGGYLYVMGVMDEAGTNSQWRLQKRNRSDGSLVSTWATSGTATVNPSSNNDPPTQMVVDVDRGIMWGVGGDRTLGTTNMQWYFTQLQLDSGTIWLAAQDTSAAASTSISFRLRMLLHVTTGNLYKTDSLNFKLQYAVKSGTCDTGFVGESYIDVPTSGTNEILYHDNPSMTNGATAQTLTGDPAHGTDPSILETTQESNNFTNGTADILNSQDGVWGFVLQDNSAFGAYCFRAVYSDGTPLASYTVIPEITFCKDDPKTDNLMRHGAYFCEGIKKSFFWAQ